MAAPRLGLAAWFGAAGAFLVMLVLAGPITLLDPQVEAAPLAASDVRSFVAGCVGLLHRPGVSSLVTAFLSTGITAYIALVFARHALRSHRDAKAHRAELRALGTPDPHTGVIVVEHARPLCYCLAGRPRHIVLSTAARDTLSVAQLDAVLAHERAHLTGHHHALLTLARGLATALPFLPLFRALPEQVELVVERLADERAGTSCGRSTVARALVRMSTTKLPDTALGATGGNLATRMTYLLHPTAARIGPSAMVLSPAVALAIALGPTALLTLACQLSWAPNPPDTSLPATENQDTTMTKNLTITLAVIAAAIISFAALLAFTNGSSTQSAAPESPQAQAAPAEMLVRPDSHRLSTSPDGKVTLVEFLDFECEACKAMFPVVEQLRHEYGNRITVVARYFPLPGHPNSGPAALAVEAAAQQGAMEPMYRKMYESQEQWSHKNVSQAETFVGYARELGLDIDRFQQAVNDPATIDRVQRDLNDGTALGVQGTPTLFLNGHQLPSMPSYDELKSQIDSALAR